MNTESNAHVSEPSDLLTTAVAITRSHAEALIADPTLAKRLDDQLTKVLGCTYPFCSEDGISSLDGKPICSLHLFAALEIDGARDVVLSTETESEAQLRRREVGYTEAEVDDAIQRGMARGIES